MKKAFLYVFFLALISTMTTNCTEPYALQTNNHEDAIVIEATLTNEFKKQEIKLSRTYRLEENGPSFEEGAIVYITDDMGNQYNFVENAEKYVSTTEFQAAPNRIYQLHITTADGKSYRSSNEQLTPVNEIQSVVPSAVTKEGIYGVEIKVNSFDPTNTSKYYRFEYEETYRIEAPKWYGIEAHPVIYPNGGDPPGEISFSGWTREARVCYSSQKSNYIILTSTNNLSEDRVNFPIRFISKEDFIITHRYSILAKQYVQNLASYTFYQTMKSLSTSESILSQTQPGFFAGNIKSINNPNEKVIGFFEVSSYSEKRIFFNFSDLFPGQAKPKFPFDCPNLTDENKEEYSYLYCFDGPPSGCKGLSVLQLLSTRVKVYSGEFDGKMVLYNIQCGDCTSIGSNIRPSFWID